MFVQIESSKREHGQALVENSNAALLLEEKRATLQTQNPTIFARIR